MAGTINYMPPETLSQISSSQDKRPYKFESDIWAVGVILHELITGVQLFVGNYAKAVSQEVGKFGSYFEKYQRAWKFNPQELPDIITQDMRKFIKYYTPFQEILFSQIAELIDSLLKNNPDERLNAQQAYEFSLKILNSFELYSLQKQKYQLDIDKKQQEINKIKEQLEELEQKIQIKTNQFNNPFLQNQQQQQQQQQNQQFQQQQQQQLQKQTLLNEEQMIIEDNDKQKVYQFQNPQLQNSQQAIFSQVQALQYLNQNHLESISSITQTCKEVLNSNNLSGQQPFTTPTTDPTNINKSMNNNNNNIAQEQLKQQCLQKLSNQLLFEQNTQIKQYITITEKQELPTPCVLKKYICLYDKGGFIKSQQYQENIMQLIDVYQQQRKDNSLYNHIVPIQNIYLDNNKINTNDNQIIKQLLNDSFSCTIEFAYEDRCLENIIVQLKQKQLNHLDKSVIKDKLNIMLTISKAVQQLHRKSIIHGNLNIRNVSFNTTTRSFKITFWSLAEMQGRQSKQDLFYFNQSYMSPQQLKGEKSTYCDDIWSLGIIFHYILTLSPLFPTNQSAKSIVLQYDQSYLKLWEQSQQEINQQNQMGTMDQQQQQQQISSKSTSLLSKVPNFELAQLINQMLSLDSSQRPLIDNIIFIINMCHK